AEADSYLAQGLHLLGGTLFLHKPLVYRMIHDDNAYISNEIFSSILSKQKTGVADHTQQCLNDAISALIANNAPLDARVEKDKSLVAKWRRSFAKRLRRYLPNGI